MSPTRTCVGCRTHLQPEDGLRVTLGRDATLVVCRIAPGRGAWLCRATASACAEAATKRRAWARALRSDVAPAQAQDLQRRLAEAQPSVGAATPER